MEAGGVGNAVASPPSTPAAMSSPHAPSPAQVVIHLRPKRDLRDFFQELWCYRELFVFLVWRDVKVRYKQAALGAAWAVIQPFTQMVVFSLVLGRLAANGVAAGSSGAPYPLYVFVGLLAWTFFSNAIVQASNSIIGDQNLVTKVYFPRLLIPAGAIGAGLVDFAIGFAMLVVMMIIYGAVPSVGVLLLPFVVLFLLTAVLGVSMLLSALTVAYRDFRYVLSFLSQVWMFATPAIYLRSGALGEGTWSWILPLNPAQGLIEAFRGCLLGTPVSAYSFAVSASVSVTLLLVGGWYFRRVERGFADII